MAGAYEAIIGLPVNKQPGAHRMIARMVDAEQQHRSPKRMKMFLRLSKLRYQATLQDIDCSDRRNLSKEKLMLFADSSYLDRGENILITGAYHWVIRGYCEYSRCASLFRNCFH